jgi:hypothetical protein
MILMEENNRNFPRGLVMPRTMRREFLLNCRVSSFSREKDPLRSL